MNELSRKEIQEGNRPASTVRWKSNLGWVQWSKALAIRELIAEVQFSAVDRTR
jgi:hypothetical protein